MPTAQPRTGVILIHGVGSHVPGGLQIRVGAVLQRLGLRVDQVVEYNWCQHVGTPRRLFGLSTVELWHASCALVHAAHVGFLGKDPSYVGLSRTPLRLHNHLALAFQLFLHFAIPIGLVFGWTRPFVAVLLLKCLLCLLIPLSLVTALAANSRAVFATVRRVVLAAVWPVSAPLMTPILTTVGTPVLFAAVHAAGFISYYSTPALYALEPVPRIYYGVDGRAVLMAVGFMLGVPVALLAGGFVLGGVIGRFAKVLADIARYIAFPEYRALILAELDPIVRELDGCDRVILAGHSLGAVIAADCLLTRPELLGTREVCLVTAGSPGDRLLARFFPEVCSWSDDLYRAMRTRVHVSWTNVFRRLDPLGGKLRLGGDCGGRNICMTRVRLRDLLGLAHVDYWADEEVLRAIGVALNERVSAPSSVAASGIDDVDQWRPSSYGVHLDRPRALIAFAGECVILAAGVCGVCGIVYLAAMEAWGADLREARRAKQYRELLDADSEQTYARVCWHKIVRASSIEGGTPSETDELEAFYRVSATRETVTRSVEETGVDMGALQECVRRRGQILGEDVQARLCAEDVQVRYLSESAEVWDLPEYQTELRGPTLLSHFTWRPLVFVFVVLFGTVAGSLVLWLAHAVVSALFLVPPDPRSETPVGRASIRRS